MEYREEAIKLLNEKLKNKNLQKHCLAVEAIMGALANHYGQPEENWRLAGLLHDVDYEETQKDLGQHSLLAAKWLKELNFPAEVVKAVRVHNHHHGIPADNLMERALIFGDAVSGLIVASALVLPSKKIADLKTENVIKRFREKSFARGVDREEIILCEKDNLSLEQLVDLSIGALRAISSDIGLGEQD